MKKNKQNFNDIVRLYNRYLRKRRNLIIANKNERRQGILLKHIERLHEKLMSLRPGLNKASLATALTVGAFTFNGSDANAQLFGAKQTNPFSLEAPTSGYGGLGSPSFYDLDNDGDLDLLATDEDGNLFYYENIGSATVPKFGTSQINPFNLSNLTTWPDATFVDLDNDGDADVMGNDGGGNWLYMENTGTVNAPDFATQQINPFNLTYSDDYAVSDFKDLDDDGDLDMIVGEYTGNFSYYENTGTVSSPDFGAIQANPFNLSYIGNYYAAPTLGDLDDDGDLDLLAGSANGEFYYYENTGTISVPDFGTPQENLYGLTGISGVYGTPTFVDLDNDGDLDMLSHSGGGNFYYYENDVCAPVDKTTFLIDETLVSNESNPAATYQWVDCDNGNSAIDLETNRFFTPSVSGSYAVVISLESCTITSDCETVTLNTVGISENSLSTVNVYPNPINNKLTIDLGKVENNSKVTITSVEGKVVYINSNLNSDKLTINSESWSKGVYVLTLTNDLQYDTIKLVKN